MVSWQRLQVQWAATAQRRPVQERPRLAMSSNLIRIQRCVTQVYARVDHDASSTLWLSQDHHFRCGPLQ